MGKFGDLLEKNTLKENFKSNVEINISINKFINYLLKDIYNTFDKKYKYKIDDIKCHLDFHSRMSELSFTVYLPNNSVRIIFLWAYEIGLYKDSLSSFPTGRFLVGNKYFEADKINKLLKRYIVKNSDPLQILTGILHLFMVNVKDIKNLLEELFSE